MDVTEQLDNMSKMERERESATEVTRLKAREEGAGEG